MNSKMTTNSQLPTTDHKKNKNKHELSKQLEQEQNHRYGDTWRVISGEGERENGGKIQGIRSRNGKYKIDRGRLRIVREMEKPKNLYVWPMDMNKVWGEEC